MFGWSTVPIGQIAIPIKRPEEPQPGVMYRQVGVRLWGEGAYERDSMDGADTKYKALHRVETDDIIVNKIWARNGSVSVIAPTLSGCYCSGEYPLFQANSDDLYPRWFYWISKARWFWDSCEEKSYGTSGKNRIRPEKFLEIEIPLPPLNEQQRIVAKIESLVAQMNEAKQLRQEILADGQAMLLSMFKTLIKGAKYLPMADVASLLRRKINIDIDEGYPELGVRCFGNGTFHKPTLDGINVGSKKLYKIEPGDLVFSNVFAWEGAIAVAQNADIGRVGSHRFITCVPKKDTVTADFLCFYFLSQQGLEKIQEASPGGAGRNRTLGLKKLAKITVPVIDYRKQLWFDQLQHKISSIKQTQADNQVELDALLPAILDKAFRGELL